MDAFGSAKLLAYDEFMAHQLQPSEFVVVFAAVQQRLAEIMSPAAYEDLHK